MVSFCQIDIVYFDVGICDSVRDVVTVYGLYHVAYNLFHTLITFSNLHMYAHFYKYLMQAVVKFSLLNM